jgi:hypothetical protein
MKKVIMFIMVVFPVVVYAQVEVVLKVHQPAVLGFEMARQDTTIKVGESVTLGQDIVVTGGAGEYAYSWSPAESLDQPLSMHPVAEPADTTVYILTVTDSNGCSFSLTYTVNVKEIDVSAELPVGNPSPFSIILYPNPGAGLFEVRLKGDYPEAIQLNIVDGAGRQLFGRTITGFKGEHTEKFNVTLSPGIYFLVAVSSETRMTRQIVIH